MERAVRKQLPRNVTRNVINDVTNNVISVMQNSIRTTSCILDRDAGRTIIGKLAHLTEAQRTNTLDLYMLLCPETLEVKR